VARAVAVVHYFTMRSDSLRPALAAGLSIAAFAFGAATLSDAVVVSARPDMAPETAIDLSVSTNALLLGIGLGLVAMLVGIYSLGQRGINNKRWVLKGIPIMVGLVILVVVVNHLIFAVGGLGAGLQVADNGTSESDNGGEQTAENSSDDDGGPIEPSGSGSFVGTVVLFGALAIGFGMIAGAEYLRDDEQDGSDRSDPEEESPDEAATIGRTAGAAADRIEADASDAGNEIYRAWREMVEQVDVENPRTCTPAEFAAAATDAGLSEAHVAELTELFEAVRYGEREVTEEREQRAVEALREIEREYGGDEK